MKKNILLLLAGCLFMPFTGVSAAAMPDLVPTSVSFSRSGRAPSASVSNQGSVPLNQNDTFVATFNLFDSNGNQIGSSMSQPLPAAYKGLAPGRSAYFSVNGHNQLTEDQAARVSQVKVVVDSSAKIIESDENNNEKIADISGAVVTRGRGVQPDLTVTSATFDRESRTTRVQILNQGTFDLTQTDKYNVRIEYLRGDGTVVTTASDHGPGSYGLAKGRSEQLDDFFKPSLDLVSHIARVRVTVDSLNTQEELNEMNNVLEATIPLPDLVISSASFSPSSRFTSVSVKNAGDVRVPGGVYPTIRVEYLDADGAVVATSGGTHTNALMPDAGAYPTQRFAPQPSTEQAGRIVNLRATIDPDNTIAESNEDNNIWPAPVVPEAPQTPEPVPETPVESVDSSVASTVSVRVLPGNPLYAFKRLYRNVRVLVTRDPEKKAEIRLENATKAQVEAILAQNKKKNETAEKRVAAAREKVEEAKKEIEKIHEKNPEKAREAAKAVIEKTLAELKKETQQQLPRTEEKKEPERRESAEESKPVVAAPEVKPEPERKPEQPKAEPKSGPVVGVSLGDGVMQLESADNSLLKGRQVEFPVVVERSNISDLQFDVLFNPAQLSFNPQSGAEHSWGAVVLQNNVTHKTAITAKASSGKVTVRVTSKDGAILDVGGPLAIANLRFTILNVPDSGISVSVGNAVASDMNGASVAVKFAGSVMVRVKVIEKAKRVCDEKVVAPVCGVDGKTYTNGCEAEKAGVAIRVEEACPSVSVIPFPSIVELRLTPNGFSPMVVDIAGGGTLVFINDDKVSHVVVRNNTVKTERIDPTEKTTMVLPTNRAIYDFISEQTPAFAATVVVH